MKTKVSMLRKCLTLFSTLVVAVIALHVGSPARAADLPLVYGIYAQVLEEPWTNVIHQALLAEQKAGKINYQYTDNIGYSGDMEKVLRDVADKKKPTVIKMTDITYQSVSEVCFKLVTLGERSSE